MSKLKNPKTRYKAIIFCLLASGSMLLPMGSKVLAKRGKHKTVKAAINEYGVPARKKLRPFFNLAKIEYPPKQLSFVGLKEEKLLYIFSKNKNGENILVKKYPIIDASGVAGPKLKEGDKQVPEGIYRITGFKPNSIAHLALLVNYPNKLDRKNARIDRRSNIGSDIEIHGSYWSTGCLAMGDPAIEEIFVLAHDTGCNRIKLILAPCNLNIQEPDIELEKKPQWVKDLYKSLEEELKHYSFVEELSKNHRYNHQSKFY